LLDQFVGALVVRPGTLLGPHLHHTLVAAGDIDHPSAFANEQREGLFHIDILARGTGQHCLQRVPVVRRGDNDRPHIAVFEKTAKVGVPFRGPA
jgi:hypothetical protein